MDRKLAVGAAAVLLTTAPAAAAVRVMAHHKTVAITPSTASPLQRTPALVQVVVQVDITEGSQLAWVAAAVRA